MSTEGTRVTLLEGNLKGIVRARYLSQGVISNIRQNLFFAYVPNALGVNRPESEGREGCDVPRGNP
jgi:Cu+-exporting ATPase